MKKTFLHLLLVLFIAAGSFATLPASAAEILEMGTIGDNIIWTFDNDNTLTISGTGEIPNYEEYNSHAQVGS